MVKKGRFTVELVDASSYTPFKEHTKDDETYVEAEPDAEYFVRIHAEVKIFVDGKFLGYNASMKRNKKGKQNTSKGFGRGSNCGLYSFDGVSSTHQALLFAKAKVFNSSDAAQENPLWTGTVTVEFREIFDTGATRVKGPSQNEWKGGDVGVGVGQTGPKMKGVVTKEGNIAVSKKRDGRRTIYRKGRILDTITLKYCSTVGLMMAGVLGPVDPYVMARNVQECKRGADTRPVDAESMPPPQKIRFVPDANGQSFGPPKEYDMFDLTNYDTDDGNERRG
jgi:hypothetical protein